MSVESNTGQPLKLMLPARSGLDLDIYYQLMVKDFTASTFCDPGDLCLENGANCVIYSDEEQDDGHSFRFDYCEQNHLVLTAQEPLTVQEYGHALLCLENSHSLFTFFADHKETEGKTLRFAFPKMVHRRQKRRLGRLPLNLSILLGRRDGRKVRAQLQDFSRSGVGLLAEVNDFTLGELVFIEFSVGTCGAIETTATIVRKEENLHQEWKSFLAARFLPTRNEQDLINTIYRCAANKSGHAIEDIDPAKLPPEPIPTASPTTVPLVATQAEDTTGLEWEGTSTPAAASTLESPAQPPEVHAIPRVSLATRMVMRTHYATNYPPTGELHPETVAPSAADQVQIRDLDTPGMEVSLPQSITQDPIPNGKQPAAFGVELPPPAQLDDFADPLSTDPLSWGNSVDSFGIPVSSPVSVDTRMGEPTLPTHHSLSDLADQDFSAMALDDVLGMPPSISAPEAFAPTYDLPTYALPAQDSAPLGGASSDLSFDALNDVLGPASFSTWSGETPLGERQIVFGEDAEHPSRTTDHDAMSGDFSQWASNVDPTGVTPTDPEPIAPEIPHASADTPILGKDLDEEIAPATAFTDDSLYPDEVAPWPLNPGSPDAHEPEPAEPVLGQTDHQDSLSTQHPDTFDFSPMPPEPQVTETASFDSYLPPYTPQAPIHEDLPVSSNTNTPTPSYSSNEPYSEYNNGWQTPAPEYTQNQTFMPTQTIGAARSQRAVVDLATIHCDKGRVQAGMGHQEEALHSYGEAINLLDQLGVTQGQGLTPRLADILGRAHLGCAEAYHALASGQAADSAEQAIRYLSTVAGQNVRRPGVRTDFARAHMILAMAQAVSEPQRAKDTLSYANNLLSALRHEHGEQVSPQVIHDQARATLCVGNLLSCEGQYTEALGQYDGSFAMVEPMLHKFQTADAWEWEHTAASVQLHKSNALYSLGQEEEALRLSAEGMERWQRLQQHLGTEFTPRHRAQMAHGFLLRAEQLMGVGEVQQARGALEQAGSAYQQLQEELGQQFRPGMRALWAEVYCQTADLQRDLGNAAASRDAALKSVEILRDLEQQLGAQFSLEMRGQLSRAYTGLGRAHSDLGENRAAMSAFDNASQVLQHV